jgi:hypothetical protein
MVISVVNALIKFTSIVEIQSLDQKEDMVNLSLVLNVNHMRVSS